MSLAILGLGTAVPTTAISQEQGLRIARSLCCRTPEQESWLPTMYRHTGISTRYLSFGDQVVADVLNGTRHSESIFLPTGGLDDCGPTTSQRMEYYAASARPLALVAARQALERSAVEPEAIRYLITVSCTGFRSPGLDCGLIDALGLSRTVERTHIGFMGCHAALNGLRVARAFARAEPEAPILLCAVELCSLHYHYGWDPQKIIANALFGDAAAALIGRNALRSRGRAWRVSAGGSCVFPDSVDAMTWTIGDHGFEMTLDKRVPGLIATHLRPWLERWLSEKALTLAGVRSWAVHPGGPKILSAIEESLPLPVDALAASRAVLADYGNVSSPTILFILDRLQRENAPRPCVALAFGPGLTVEAALLL